MKYFLTIITLYIFTITSNELYAQFNLSVGPPPENLVQEICDTSIIFNNVEYIGTNVSNAIFSANTVTDLNMDQGIVITTGYANDFIGPNNSTQTGTSFGYDGLPIMDSLFGMSSYDINYLGFDFTTSYDMVQLKCIFGSEEYPEFVYYGEGVGFFVSGSSPFGGFYTDSLIGYVPGTTDYIGAHSINNVIPSNEWFYVDNIGGVYIDYDDLQPPLFVEFYVQPDSIYNIKLMIADAFDAYMDSGFFIEKGSFKGVNSTDITEFSFLATNNLNINEDYFGEIVNDTIFFSFPYATDLTNFISTFSLRKDAHAFIDGVLQVSDSTINNFTAPLNYSIISATGASKEYTIECDILPNSENQILAFDFQVENNPELPFDIEGVINQNYIYCAFPPGVSTSNLIAIFELSEQASAWIGDEYQISGVTPNDFSDTLYYKIVAGNNDTNVYKVYVDYETIITSKINETSFIFPNPTSNYIYINGFSNTEFKLYKLSGELEFSSFLKSDNEKIDISNFKAGTYFVMIRSTKYTISDKLLIN